MRSYFLFVLMLRCTALCFFAFAVLLIPAAAQEKPVASADKSPRFALSFGVYNGAQLFNYEDQGVAVRLDYTFYRLPRHEAVVSLLYADVTSVYKPSFFSGSFFGSGNMSGSVTRKGLWLGSAEYRWRFGSGNHAYIGLGLGIGDSTVVTLPVGYDFGSLFVEARAYVGGDDNGPTLSSTLGFGVRF